jgi:hypothetical protein
MRYCLACPAGYTTTGSGASSCSVKCPGYDYTATWETSSCTSGSSCTNVCTPKTCKGGAKIIDGVCKEYGETFNNNGVYVTNDTGSVCLVCNGMYDDTSSNDQYIYSGSHAPGVVTTTLCNTVSNYNINETYGSRTCTSSGWDMTGATYRQYYWKTYTGNIQVMYYKDYTNGTAGTETRLAVGGSAYNTNGWLVRCKPGYKLSITTSGANYVARQTDTVKEVWSKSAPSTSYITCTSCPTGTTLEDEYCHAGGTSAPYVDGAMVREYKKSTDRPRESCSSNSTGNMYCGWGYYGTPTWHSSLAEYYGCYECPSAWQYTVGNSSGSSSYCITFSEGHIESDVTNNTTIAGCYVNVPSGKGGNTVQYHKDDTGTFTMAGHEYQHCNYSTTAVNNYSTICPADGAVVNDCQGTTSCSTDSDCTANAGGTCALGCCIYDGSVAVDCSTVVNSTGALCPNGRSDCPADTVKYTYACNSGCCTRLQRAVVIDPTPSCLHGSCSSNSDCTETGYLTCDGGCCVQSTNSCLHGSCTTNSQCTDSSYPYCNTSTGCCTQFQTSTDPIELNMCSGTCSGTNTNTCVVPNATYTVKCVNGQCVC